MCSGTGLLRQLYDLSHWVGRCGSHLLFHQNTVNWHGPTSPNLWRQAPGGAATGAPSLKSLYKTRPERRPTRKAVTEPRSAALEADVVPLGQRVAFLPGREEVGRDLLVSALWPPGWGRTQLKGLVHTHCMKTQLEVPVSIYLFACLFHLLIYYFCWIIICLFFIYWLIHSFTNLYICLDLKYPYLLNGYTTLSTVLLTHFCLLVFISLAFRIQGFSSWHTGRGHVYEPTVEILFDPLSHWLPTSLSPHTPPGCCWLVA